MRPMVPTRATCLSVLLASGLSACCQWNQSCSVFQSEPTGPPVGSQLTIEAPTRLEIAPGARRSVDVNIGVTRLTGQIDLIVDDAHILPSTFKVTLPSSVQGSSAPTTRTVRLTVEVDPIFADIQQTLQLTLRAEAGPNASSIATATVDLVIVRPFDLVVPPALSVVAGQQAPLDVDVIYAPDVSTAYEVDIFAIVPQGWGGGGFAGRVKVNQSGRTSLALDVPSATQDGTYPVQVQTRANLGRSTHEVTYQVNVNVSAAPLPADFVLLPATTTLTAVRGTTASTRVLISRTGSVGPVSLSIVGAPADVQATFSDPMAAGNFSDLALAAGPAAPLGRHALTLRGTAAGLTRDYPLALDVAAGPPPIDFTLAPAAPAVTVAQNGSAVLRIDATRLSGSASTIDLTMNGQPAAVTIAAPPILPSSATTIMVIDAGAGAPVGTSTVTVTGNSGGVVRTTTFVLTVVARALTIIARPSAITAAQGSSANIMIDPIWTGTPAPVAVSTANVPVGVIPTVIPPQAGASQSTVVLDIGQTTVPGTYQITVHGTGAGFTASTTLALTVTALADFSLRVSPSAIPVVKMGTGNASAFIVRDPMFTSIVSLDATSAAPGLAVTFSPASTSGTGSQVAVRARAWTPAGSHQVIVRGTFGTLSRTTSFVAIVTEYGPPSGFILDVESPLTLIRGSSTGVTGAIGVLRAPGFTGPVTLTVNGAPPGLSVTLGQIPLGGTVGSITLVADQRVNTGSLTIQVVATGGGVTVTQDIRVQVGAP